MNVFIIGGGAAGMIAAYFAAKQSNNVELLEQNSKLGRKIYITGKGRCNLTNDCDFDEFLTNIVSNGKFLSGALRAFSPQDTLSFFESIKLPLKVERGNRVFPKSDKASDVTKALQNALIDLGVKISTDEKVTQLVVEGNKVTKIKTSQKVVENPDRVIIACGGISYKGTGSTGDGFVFAERAGHTIITLAPALTSITLSAAYDCFGAKIPLKSLPPLEGISLKNVTAKILQDGKLLHTAFGEMLFTHDGVSGPIVLTLSSLINRLDVTKLKLEVDLKASLDEKTLDERLVRELAANSNKILKNMLPALLPAKLVPFIAELSRINGEKQMNSVTKDERKNLLNLFKKLTFDINSLGNIDSAVVTAGGVSVKEVNPKNMRSKLVDNLAFAGEVLDIDALTGGFNLQIAFSTGYLAGSRIND